MLNFDVSWLHVAALALANFIIGAAWYSFLFLKPWLKALKLDPEQMRKDPEIKRRTPFLIGSAAVSALIMSWASGVVVASVHAGDAFQGAVAGIFIALALVAAHASGSLFERRPVVVYGIATLHALVIFSLDCAIQASWH
jgi:hypothetical protein